MSIAWVAEQIRAATAGQGVQPPGLIRFNPKPPGQSQPGSATEAVIAFLAKTPGVFYTYGQIHEACPDFSRSAVTWALIRLHSWEAIERTPEWTPGKSTRYLRYRLPPKAVP